MAVKFRKGDEVVITASREELKSINASPDVSGRQGVVAAINNAYSILVKTEERSWSMPLKYCMSLSDYRAVKRTVKRRHFIFIGGE